MIAKSSGFTLIELLVVVAIIGILSAVGIVSYQGYVSGTKQKSAENAMQQIALAQTEEYSNSGDYYTQGEECDLEDNVNSNLIEENLFDGGDVITKEAGYEMCIEPFGTTYLVKASNGKIVEQPNGTKVLKLITMTANGVWFDSQDADE